MAYHEGIHKYIIERSEEMKKEEDRIRNLLIFGTKSQVEEEFKRICKKHEDAEREDYESLKEKFGDD